MLPPVRQRLKIIGDLAERDEGDPDPRAGVGRDGRRPVALARFDLPEVPHRPVQDGHAGLAARARHRLGEEDRILVVEEIQVGVELVVVAEQGRAEPAPLPKIIRDGDRGPRSERAVGHVGHHVHPEHRDERDPRILGAGVALPALPGPIRRQHDALPLHADRDPVLDDQLGQADPGHVAGRDQSRQQIRRPVGCPAGAGIEDALDLLRVARLGTHDHADPGEPVAEVTRRGRWAGRWLASMIIDRTANRGRPTRRHYERGAPCQRQAVRRGCPDRSARPVAHNRVGQGSVLSGASGNSRASTRAHSSAGWGPGQPEPDRQVVGVDQGLHDSHRGEAFRIGHPEAVVGPDRRRRRPHHGDQQRAARLQHLQQPGRPRGVVRVDGVARGRRAWRADPGRRARCRSAAGSAGRVARRRRRGRRRGARRSPSSPDVLNAMPARPSQAAGGAVRSVATASWTA